VRIADNEIILPHAAASFDLVFSETVIEHCFALDGMMRECARVLKRNGISVHTYPGRNSFLESHLYVPFGGRIQARWWLMLWAVLGVRNLGQPNQTAAQTAERNQEWMKIGVCYRPDREIAAIARRHFDHVSFERRAFFSHDPPPAQIKRYWAALTGKNKLARLAEVPRLQILVAKHAA
jgi:SAM-dependent methyltransferase